jgi:hypothetical protein
MSETLIETTFDTVSTEAAPAGYVLPKHDLYRDIHKGIRAELFAITGAAGSLDPTDTPGWVDLANHVNSVWEVLESHAHHEDSVIEPVLFDLRPNLAESIAADHVRLDARFHRILDIANAGGTTPATDQARQSHVLYLELSGFTSTYFEHILVEEYVVMPVLDAALGIEQLLAMHGAIIGSIPPDQMARSLAFMFPAMNVDNRTEVLGGMQQTAPPEAFAGVVSLARSVLDPTDFAAVATRLGLG